MFHQTPGARSLPALEFDKRIKNRRSKTHGRPLAGRLICLWGGEGMRCRAHARNSLIHSAENIEDEFHL
jgi:hypothetical protein